MDAAARAEEAWSLQYRDPRASLALAQSVLDGAAAPRARAWAALAVAYYRLRYGPPAEARRALDEAAGALAGSVDARAQAVLANGRARQRAIEGDLDGAIALFSRTLAEHGHALDSAERCQSLNGLAGCLWEKGEWAESLAHAFEALNLMRAAGPSHPRVALQINVGMQLVTVGDYVAAHRILTEAREGARDFDHPGLQQGLRAALIHCEIDAGRAADALPLVDEIRAFGPVAESSADAADIVHAVAEALIANGRLAEAAAELDRAARIAQGQAHAGAAATNRFLRGLAAFAGGDPARAREDAGAALASMAGLTLPAVTARAHRLLAEAAAATGDFESAYLHHREFFRHHEARLGISARAHYHALAIRHELERTREAATHDHLTGLYNRHYLEPVLDNLVALSRRQAEPLSLAMLDLDHFKAVNDRHGHAAGDRVLAALGALIRRALRESDIACRYGGEEICLVFPGTAQNDAARKVEGLLAAWRGEALFEGEAPQTFSAGVAMLGAGEGAAELIARADAALYAGKRAGRDRVVRGE